MQVDGWITVEAHLEAGLVVERVHVIGLRHRDGLLHAITNAPAVIRYADVIVKFIGVITQCRNGSFADGRDKAYCALLRDQHPLFTCAGLVEANGFMDVTGKTGIGQHQGALAGVVVIGWIIDVLIEAIAGSMPEKRHQGNSVVDEIAHRIGERELYGLAVVLVKAENRSAIARALNDVFVAAQAVAYVLLFILIRSTPEVNDVLHPFGRSKAFIRLHLL